MALALHELTTNSIKYGALSVAGGSVSITWSAIENDVARGEGRAAFRLEWQDRGGPEVKPPLAEGFGSRLIKRVLAADFEGKVSIEYAPAGVRVVLVGLLKSLENQP